MYTRNSNIVSDKSGEKSRITLSTSHNNFPCRMRNEPQIEYVLLKEKIANETVEIE